MNDNPPEFIYSGQSSKVVKDQYLTAISDVTPINDLVFTVKVKYTGYKNGMINHLAVK